MNGIDYLDEDQAFSIAPEIAQDGGEEQGQGGEQQGQGGEQQGQGGTQQASAGEGQSQGDGPSLG